MLKKVQRKATKIPHNMKGLKYEDRLKELGLTTLETRRVRGDCMQMYKINKGLDELNWHSGPIPGPTTERPVRVVNRRLKREIVNCDRRHHFFTNRIVGDWNVLPESVVNAGSVNSFKAKYDQIRNVCKKNVNNV